MTLSQMPPIWKEAPFLRILVPFVAGILLQDNVNIDGYWVVILLFVLSSLFLLLHFRSLYFKFKYNWITGIFLQLVLISLGFLITAAGDGTKQDNSIINVYSAGDALQVTLQEPLIEKEKSYKATASIDYLSKNNSLMKATGKINIYFSKDTINEKLSYGSSMIISKPIELIRSSGNPGAFDYKLYCQRQGIYHSVFLTAKDYHQLHNQENVLKKLLFKTRQSVVNILSTYISGLKESGLAKALLIGYKDDLDKNLVQAYSNTGVVHIIAISGLHLGIIYWLLSLIVAPLQKTFRSKLISTCFILAGLWSFSFLAGAGPSVLRSAFMFSMIALGSAFSKNSNVYNNLAFSAFALLCYNPYWLWDAGFQLSYAAVLSIVLFFKSIYNWFYFSNKIVDFAWKLIAVTLSAQILTLPISIYHFHQLPVYFILSNLVAVPLSSLILIGEILLCCFSFLPSMALIVGDITTWLIRVLNTYVQNINQLPLAVWGSLQISFLQMLLLFSIIGGLTAWAMNKQKRGLWIGLTGLLIFSIMRTSSFLGTHEQLKLIVYNLQNSTAVDFINGRKFNCVSDSEVIHDLIIQNLNLNPSRVLHRVKEEPNGLINEGPLYLFGGKAILLVDKPFDIPSKPSQIEILILSKNPGIQLPELIRNFRPQQIIADASNKAYKADRWKREADSLGISFHNVRLEGAYVQNLR